MAPAISRSARTLEGPSAAFGERVRRTALVNRLRNCCRRSVGLRPGSQPPSSRSPSDPLADFASGAVAFRAPSRPSHGRWAWMRWLQASAASIFNDCEMIETAGFCACRLPKTFLVCLQNQRARRPRKRRRSKKKTGDIMRSTIARLAAGAVVFAFAAAPSFAQERVVNVYNWSDYIDSSILEDFTKETGIKVVYDTFDSNETVETKLLAGGTGYDVVVPTGDLPAAPDPGRRLPEARQVQAAEPLQSCGTYDPAASPPCTIRVTNTPWTTCGAPTASATTSKKVAEILGRTQRAGPWKRSSIRRLPKVQGLRHLCPRCTEGRHSAGLDLSRP